MIKERKIVDIEVKLIHGLIFAVVFGLVISLVLRIIFP